MKKALTVGIDHYAAQPLRGCVNDARAVSMLLERNGDGSPNFSVVELTSEDGVVDAARLSGAVEDLFAGDAETVLMYFAGHGIVNRETNAGYMVAQDGRRGSWGMGLSEVLELANRAYPRIKSSVIILDSCQSGYAGEVAGLGTDRVSVIGTGVTILTASHREGTAAEGPRHGLFTSLILDGLKGGSSDIMGNITPASLYSHVDQALGPWEQRPLYKANVQTFVTLRQVAPKIAPEVIRRLPQLFPDAAGTFRLDPSFEPARDNVPLEVMEVPPDPANVLIFRALQACNRHGLVEPVDAEHMYYAAINSTGCRLTALGLHYRSLAEMKRI